MNSDYYLVFQNCKIRQILFCSSVILQLGRYNLRNNVAWYNVIGQLDETWHYYLDYSRIGKNEEMF